jgi:hypothetical protein
MVAVVFMLLAGAPVCFGTAHVEWVAGDVSFSNVNDGWEELEVGMDLSPGDMVRTGASSEATLLHNGSEIHLLENSRFTVSEKYEEGKKKSSFMLFLGRIRFKLGKGRGEEPEFQTQTVNLTIRGTEFEVGSGYDGSTLVILQEGSISVEGREQQLVLNPGEGTEVGFGEEPAEKFTVMTRVIDWDQWASETRESVQGNEQELLRKILTRISDIKKQIEEYERIREQSQAERDRLVQERDRLLEDGRDEEASKTARQAGGESKRAFHALVNIRFLALSSIGLYDMSERIHAGVQQPSDQITETYTEIGQVYAWIRERYILEGDRERLEEKQTGRKGCSSLF